MDTIVEGVRQPSGGVPPRPADVHLLRAPFYDADLTLAGYELFAGDGPDAERAAALEVALTELPISVLGGGGLLFVRAPRAMLIGDTPPPPVPGLVLEVAEERLADPAVVAGLQSLAADGFRLSLVGREWSAAVTALLPLFDLFRVDVARVGSAGLLALASRLRRTSGALFVDSVETLAQLEACRRVGAVYLTGGLVSRPPIVADGTLAPSQVACLRLATALVRPEADLTEIEFAVRSDPGLTMRVLKAVNSADSGLRQRVSSIRQAVVLLGPRVLLGAVLSAGLARGGSPTPPEAIEAVLVRARMCELLAGTGFVGRPLDGSVAFTVGLVSGLDVLLGADPVAVLGELPVDEAVENAILRRTGPLGAVLADVLAYEQGQPTRLLAVASVRALFLASLSWATPLAGSSPG
jgi:EAL and modified HD-GYP domain-containing signal transduction protein